MRGEVLGYDITTGEGVISGTDGLRYPVRLKSLKGGARSLLAGKRVDFDVVEGRAEEVYVLPGTVNFSETNRFIAAVLAFMLGIFGAHKFYMGKKRTGVIMLLCFFPGMFLGFPLIAVWVISIAETIIYLVKDDQDFHEQYVIGDRSWF